MKKILLLSLIILSSNIVLGQFTTIECPDHVGTPKAQRRVGFFLTVADRQDERELVGATNETVEQIEYVTDAAACNSLMAIINGTEKYRTINDGLEGTERTIYLYKTNNLYYIF